MLRRLMTSGIARFPLLVLYTLKAILGFVILF